MTGVRTHRTALLSLSLCVLAIASCRTANEPSANVTPKTDTVVSTTPPFKTKEPDRYSATRTITIFSPNGDTVVSSTLIARDGPRRHEEPRTEQVRVVYLDLPDGRFVVYPDEKIYAAATSDEAPANSQFEEADESSPDRLLHTDPISTTYQSLGAETIAGRSTSKYRIVVNNSAVENVSPNETLMWIDDALHMPIKSETKSPDGTRTVMELAGVTLDPDKQLFEIPMDYKKVPFSTIQKQLRARGLNP
jgi:hypothetical protein